MAWLEAVRRRRGIDGVRRGGSGALLHFDLFCLLLYAFVSLTPASNLPVHLSECTSVSEELCPTREASCRCVSLGDKEESPGHHLPVLCCHLATGHKLWTEITCAMSDIVARKHIALHIWDSTLQGLAQSEDVPSAMLSSLTVTHSVIPPDDIRPLTAMASSVACLNLSSNGMGDLPPGALTGLTQMKVLDLSRNNITQLPDLPHRVTVDQKPLWVDISGNDGLLCYGIKEAMSWNTSARSHNDPSPRLATFNSSATRDATLLVVNESSLPQAHAREGLPLPVLFHNKEQTYCIGSNKNLWFQWTVRIPLDKIEDITKLECPSGHGYTCACSIKRFEQSDFSVAVDCSGRGLTELPAKLPNHTTSLNVTNNKINSLGPFGVNSCYSKIRDFYADNNEITSIDVLEGTDFLNNFQHLSLSANKLKNLPLYLLNGMFNQDSQVIRYLSLGRNEYHCDCNTYSGLKDWILRNKKQLTDHEEMQCDSEVPNTKIIDLQADDVCLQKDWKDYLPFVVLVEVLLLIIIVTKVSYDYWIFKTKGYLPWPASKTPKLPCCDWAFDA